MIHVPSLLGAYIAAKDPPTPMAHKDRKSARMKIQETAVGGMIEYCLPRAHMKRDSETKRTPLRKLGAIVKQIMYLRSCHVNSGRSLRRKAHMM